MQAINAEAGAWARNRIVVALGPWIVSIPEGNAPHRSR